jgi:hypothetical protein
LHFGTFELIACWHVNIVELLMWRNSLIVYQHVKLNVLICCISLMAFERGFDASGCINLGSIASHNCPRLCFEYFFLGQNRSIFLKAIKGGATGKFEAWWEYYQVLFKLWMRDWWSVCSLCKKQSRPPTFHAAFFKPSLESNYASQNVFIIQNI